MTIDVRPAAGRFVTRTEGRTTQHSFSFGAHYDPVNVGFGVMTAHNDEHLPPGTGYPDHPHADVEIVTVVLSGALRHTDSGGRTGVLAPGQVSRTSAGAGIVHAEVADSSAAGTTRFVQTWLRPDEPGGASSYAVCDVGAPEVLTEVVGPDGSTGLGVRGARLLVARPRGGRLTLPDAPLLHVFVADGCVDLGERALDPGDAARLTGEGGRDLLVETPSSLLVWALPR